MRNFTTKELACRCCGVANTDPSFADRLQVLRDLCGFALVVTSGYRCEAHNQATAGSASGSLHTQGRAVDIATQSMSGNELHALLRSAYALGFGGIGVYKTHVHLDLGKARAWVG